MSQVKAYLENLVERFTKRAEREFGKKKLYKGDPQHTFKDKWELLDSINQKVMEQNYTDWKDIKEHIELTLKMGYCRCPVCEGKEKGECHTIKEVRFEAWQLGEHKNDLMFSSAQQVRDAYCGVI